MCCLIACDPDVPTPPSTTGNGESVIITVEGDTTGLHDSIDINTLDVILAPTDTVSYHEVPEEIITDEDHGDYSDFIENYEINNTVVITYNDGKATSRGVPSEVKVTIKGAHVEVNTSKEGIAYTLVGSTPNGSFKLYSKRKAQITLGGVSITNPTGAAINIQSGKTMLIDLAEGTTNHLEDGSTYTMKDDEQQKGTLFSEGQLVFSGSGSLYVKSHYGHGIASDDYVRMRGGKITIDAVRDGISTSDRFVMYGGVASIVAQQDGIDVDEGYIEIGGGKLSVNAVDEGIVASYDGEDDGTINEAVTPYINIKGGLIQVTTTGDKGHGLRAMSTFTLSSGTVQATVKGLGSKALMSEGDMSLANGKVTALTEGAALYEMGDLSSSAAIRSKGALKIEHMTLGAKSTGTGGKGINNIGDITIKDSHVTVVTTGGTHLHGDLDSRSRGVATDGNFTLDGSLLLVKSTDDPLRIRGLRTFLNEAVYVGYQTK